jgi:hypothetical protein
VIWVRSVISSDGWTRLCGIVHGLHNGRQLSLPFQNGDGGFEQDEGVGLAAPEVSLGPGGLIQGGMNGGAAPPVGHRVPVNTGGAGGGRDGGTGRKQCDDFLLNGREDAAVLRPGVRADRHIKSYTSDYYFTGVIPRLRAWEGSAS